MRKKPNVYAYCWPRGLEIAIFYVSPGAIGFPGGHLYVKSIDASVPPMSIRKYHRPFEKYTDREIFGIFQNAPIMAKLSARLIVY